MDLSALTKGIQIDRAVGPTDARVCDVTDDSRTAVPGSLFIARTGTADSGSSYAHDALGLGAVAVLTDDPALLDSVDGSVSVLYTPDAARAGCVIAERFYGDPSEHLVVGAVTGTNGKSSVAYLVDSILDHTKQRCGIISTVEIDDGRERSRAVLTTPPGVELSRTLATMREHGCVACVMETSSHALDQGRASAIMINAAAFTNLSGDHLDYHGDLASYTAAKARLFAQLGDGAHAVLNVDDPAHAAMLDACGEGVGVVRCSMEKSAADWTAQVLEQNATSMTIALGTPHGDTEIRVPFFGAHNASNTLVACALADVMLADLGVNAGDRLAMIAAAGPYIRLPPGRLERVDRDGDSVRVFVDFAHTDDALAHALAALRGVTPKASSLWCVFGCGGDRDTTKRTRMGRVVSEHADRVVVTSDNPRSEPPSEIVGMVLEGVDRRACEGVDVHVDRAAAIAFAVTHAAPGDVVVIAGKGHETEQITRGADGSLVRTRFDDAEHAREALASRRAQGVSA